jgi:hypothetical protein
MADQDELEMLRESVGRAATPVAGEQPDPATAWGRVHDIGWDDAFVPRAEGQGVAEAIAVAEECGRQAIPVAVTALVVGRAAAVRRREKGADSSADERAVVWATELLPEYWRSSAAGGAGGPDACVVVPGFDIASHLIVTTPDDTFLWRTSDLVATACPIETLDGAVPTWLVRIDDDTRACAAAHEVVSRAQPGGEHEFLRNLSMLVAAAQAYGLLDRALHASVEYACDRTAFGRPIGSFQAVKHMLADNKMSLETSRAIVDDAVRRIDDRHESADFATAVAARLVGRSVLDGLQRCVQVHGGIGVTMECELHELVRRATVARFLYMEPNASGRRILELRSSTELGRV